MLVICGRNKKRSRTAEYIYKNDARFSIRSAGISSKSEKLVTENDLLWADIVFVMETGYGARIAGQFRHLELPRIVNLNIPDDYEFMDEELVELLKERISYSLQHIFDI